jgi:CubicO group peptidase (beta-lactamase class C family)
MSTLKYWPRFVLLLIVTTATVACAVGTTPTAPSPDQPSLMTGASSKPAQTDPDVESVIWPTKAWTVSSPEEQDMDPGKLAQMMLFIDENNVAVDSVVVVRHGQIVWEEYRNNYSAETPHHIQSVTKSVTSILIGIALTQGLIETVQQPMVSFFPDHDIDNLDGRKERITLEHLLTMSEGMDWHEWDFAYDDRRNSLGRMWASHDAVQHVLDTPMAREPGDVWAYNSGTSILLGGIIERVTGQDTLSFAREHLFDPIGVSYVYWDKARGNHYHTDGGLFLKPRDMARLGYLMLNGGIWDGKQIVSPDWVAASSAAHRDTGIGYGYGYQWWTLPGDAGYAATGHFEQKIYVIPEADMVVVFTANIADEDPHVTDALLYRYILTSCDDLAKDPAIATYSAYGMQFDYTAGSRAIALPIPGQDKISDASGMLVVVDDYYPRRVVTAMWDSLEEDAPLEESLNAFLASQSGELDVELPQLDDWQAGEHSDHRMLFVGFSGGDDTSLMSGVVGAWICSQTKRIHVFMVLCDDPSQSAPVQAMFDDLLAGFHCHEDAASTD